MKYIYCLLVLGQLNYSFAMIPSNIPQTNVTSDTYDYTSHFHSSLNQYNYKNSISHLVTTKNRIKSKLITSVHNELIIVETDKIIISYNQTNGLLTMCTSDLLMIDLDYKDPQVRTKKNALSIVENYSIKNNLTFAVRESDRGIHAFLLSKKMHPNLAQGNTIMKEMHSDKKYIAFSKIKGYCSRIGPKIFPVNDIAAFSKKIIRSEEEIKNEFISRPIKNDIVGDVNNIDSMLYNTLLLNDAFVRTVKNSFNSNYKAMTSATIRNVSGLIPINVLRKFIPLFIYEMKKKGIRINGEFPFIKGMKSLFTKEFQEEEIEQEMDAFIAYASLEQSNDFGNKTNRAKENKKLEEPLEIIGDDESLSKLFAIILDIKNISEENKTNIQRESDVEELTSQVQICRIDDEQLLSKDKKEGKVKELKVKNNPESKKRKTCLKNLPSAVEFAKENISKKAKLNNK